MYHCLILHENCRLCILSLLKKNFKETHFITICILNLYSNEMLFFQFLQNIMDRLLEMLDDGCSTNAPYSSKVFQVIVCNLSKMAAIAFSSSFFLYCLVCYKSYVKWEIDIACLMGLSTVAKILNKYITHIVSLLRQPMVTINLLFTIGRFSQVFVITQLCFWTGCRPLKLQPITICVTKACFL